MNGQSQRLYRADYRRQLRRTSPQQHRSAYFGGCRSEKDASVWQFGGESNTLTGLYFRGYQLDARQFSVNGLAGMYGTQGTASVQVGSAQLIKGASTAVNGMNPEGAVSGSVNIETKSRR